MATDTPNQTAPKSRARRASDLGASMSVAIILAWLARQAGIEVPGEITAAIATLVGFLGSFVSDYIPRRGDRGNGGGPPGGGATSLLAGIALLFAAGCSNLAAPQTPEQRLAYVDSQFAALVETAADLHEQGVLDAGDAAELDPLIQRGDRALTTAWAAVGRGEPESATDYIRIVNRLLPKIRNELQEARDVDGSND